MLEKVLSIGFIIVASLSIATLMFYLYKTKTKQVFKFIFFTLAGLSLLAFSLIFIMFCYYATDINDVVVSMIPLTTILLFKFLAFKLVFKDATLKSLNPWFSVIICLFVPNILGIIIYLIMRNKGENSNVY